METARKIVVSIDDTDDIDSKGTGTIASELRDIIKSRGGKCGYITRHQLLIHPDIKYTSHNSSMVFSAVIYESVEELADILCEHIKKEASPVSDPGICIFEEKKAINIHTFLAFGALAKNKVLIKKEAYDVARKTNTYLKELGGTGIGIIGALAGASLRYSGNDGELKGGSKEFEKDKVYTVRQLLANKNIDEVRSVDGKSLSIDTEVYVPWKVKPILTNNKLVVFVKPLFDRWVILEKEENRKLIKSRQDITACERFKADVEEEQISSAKDTCLNCTYRRWTSSGFTCEYKR